MAKFLNGADYDGPLKDYANELKQFKEQVGECLSKVKREYETVAELFTEFERYQAQKNIGRPVFSKGVGHFTAMLDYKGDAVLTGIEEDIQSALAEIKRQTDMVKDHNIAQLTEAFKGLIEGQGTPVYCLLGSKALVEESINTLRKLPKMGWDYG